MTDLAHSPLDPEHGDGTRRDFLLLSAGALGAVGAAVSIWPFIDSLNPARDTLALSTTEVVDSASVSRAGLRLSMNGQIETAAPTAPSAPALSSRKSRRVPSPCSGSKGECARSVIPKPRYTADRPEALARASYTLEEAELCD